MVSLSTRPGSDNKWVFLDIPEKLRPAFGGKRRFAASTGTSDRNKAKVAAAKIEADWRRQIQDARDGVKRATEDQERTAESWARVYRAATPDKRRVMLDFIEDDAAERVGLPFAHMADDPEHATDEDRKEVEEYVAIATGEIVPFTHHLDAYIANKAGSREAKTLDQARSIIQRLAAKFKYTRNVTRRGVQEYVNELTTEGASPQTIRRLVSQLRTYWRYLQSLEIVADGPTPFDDLQRHDGGKAQRAKKRQAFTAKEVSTLIAEARKRDDEQLAEAVTIFAYSGMRLDELASMKLEQVRQGCFHIKEEGDGKSDAAVRVVPVHSKIAGLVKRLCKASKDGYLISGLPAENKYSKRGISLGDKFGRLKRAMGFDGRYVLHSIRHTVTTQLERAGVPENVAADILGHEKPRVTYGTYGHGSSLKQKRAAIEKLKYPTR